MRKVLALFALILIPFSIKAASNVDLLWQGQTYTPPFYEGRALWSYQSRVKLVAVPHIAGRDSSTLYFRWSQDGTILGSLSGVGKKTLSLMDSALSLATEVRVDVMATADGSPLASASVALKPVPWKAFVYEDSPLYGTLFNRAVTDKFSLDGQEVTFLAVPFFSTVTMKTAPAISYSWTTNTGDSRAGDSVTYRVPEGSTGESAVTFRAENSQIIQEPIIKSFSIEFTNQNAL